MGRSRRVHRRGSPPSGDRSIRSALPRRRRKAQNAGTPPWPPSRRASSSGLVRVVEGQPIIPDQGKKQPGEAGIASVTLRLAKPADHPADPRIWPGRAAPTKAIRHGGDASASLRPFVGALAWMASYTAAVTPLVTSSGSTAAMACPATVLRPAVVARAPGDAPSNHRRRGTERWR